MIPPSAWALEEVEFTDSRPTPFSVLSSGANWWGKSGWSGPWKQLDWSGSLLFACYPELAPLISGPPEKNAGQLPFLLRPLPWASGVIITTALEAPRNSPSQLLEKPFLVTAEGEGQDRSHPARQLGPPPPIRQQMPVECIPYTSNADLPHHVKGCLLSH